MENIKKHLMQLPLGICAGISIGLGGFLFTVISFALPNIYGKVLGSIAFAIGLFLVCTFYFSLYTGKVGIAIENKGPKDAIIDLPIMLLGNLGGAIGFGYLMHLFFQNTDMMATFTKIALSRAKDFTGNATFEMFVFYLSPAIFHKAMPGRVPTLLPMTTMMILTTAFQLQALAWEK